MQHDGLNVSTLITVRRAEEIIDSTAIPVPIERIELDRCAGLYLAEDLRNDRDSPPFDKSLMDGYAVRSADLAGAPCELTVVERIMAGGSAALALGERQAMAIMTGAPLPAGADAVVPIEQSRTIAGTHRVSFDRPAKRGQSIAARGSDAPAGAVVLRRGTRLDAAQIAVAASIGAISLPVNRPPSVAVLGTGDELVAPNQTPGTNQIRSCNNPMLLALLRRWTCHATDLGIVGDDPHLIEQSILSGLAHDVLLITGGMSVGERDFVPGILRKLGGELKITKLRIKPGKPLVFAQMPGKKFVFGLPGNPVSAFVCTLCLAGRLLQRMAGGLPHLPAQTAPLSEALPPNGNRTFFQPAIFDGRAIVPLQWKGSADIFTLSQANALLIRPENQPAQAAGAVVEFIALR